MSEHIPHPANVAGDFYVEDGCCITCMVPHGVAPDLMAMSEDENHCYVCKQPATPEELERMFEAFEVQEVDCIRYKGVDRAIQIRLVRASSGNQCDKLLDDLVEVNRSAKALASERHLAWVVARGPQAELNQAIATLRSWVGDAAAWISTCLKKKS